MAALPWSGLRQTCLVSGRLHQENDLRRRLPDNQVCFHLPAKLTHNGLLWRKAATAHTLLAVFRAGCRMQSTARTGPMATTPQSISGDRDAPGAIGSDCRLDSR